MTVRFHLSEILWLLVLVILERNSKLKEASRKSVMNFFSTEVELTDTKFCALAVQISKGIYNKCSSRLIIVHFIHGFETWLLLPQRYGQKQGTVNAVKPYLTFRAYWGLFPTCPYVIGVRQIPCQNARSRLLNAVDKRLLADLLC